MRVKSKYKISEISSMFGIGLDSLRYYERLGILSPERDPTNDYRYYGLEDIKALNLLIELRQLGFTIAEIRDYLHDRSVQRTKGLLEAEIDSIDRQIERLLQTKQSIEKRLSNIRRYYPCRLPSEIVVHEYPERYGIVIESLGNTVPELNYVTRVLLSVDERALYSIGNCDCYLLDAEETDNDSLYLTNKNIFFLLDERTPKSNFTLPQGTYLSVSYTGELRQTRTYVEKLMNYCLEKGLRAISDPIEMCRIDTFETDRQEEYVTEIQLRVSAE